MQVPAPGQPGRPLHVVYVGVILAEENDKPPQENDRTLRGNDKTLAPADSGVDEGPAACICKINAKGPPAHSLLTWRESKKGSAKLSLSVEIYVYIHKLNYEVSSFFYYGH